MLNITVKTLSFTLMKKIVDKLVELDKIYIQEMQESFCTFPWGKEHYMRDLEGKWTLSQVAYAESAVIGAWIASHTVPGICHSHRVLVDPRYQGKGIAYAMFECLEKAAVDQGLIKMTVEASIFNHNAKSFYESLGFDKIFKKDIEDYLHNRQRNALVLDDCLEEDDKSRYIVYVKNIK